jgi:hypothetical protein
LYEPCTKYASKGPKEAKKAWIIAGEAAHEKRAQRHRQLSLVTVEHGSINTKI